LISAAREHRLPALSLSVEIDNGARRLYQRVGFEKFNVVGGTLTLLGL
jgi:ribosomal protein S18 acetylase RimI-like enzyme